jgi:hypothetical protein
LILAANCSAAETIFKAFSRRPSPRARPARLVARHYLVLRDDKSIG